MEANELKVLAQEIAANLSINTKNILSCGEAARYSSLSPSYLYKLTSARKIPHYKPQGKLVYFRRADLDEWLLSNRVATMGELDQQARACEPNNKKLKGANHER